MKTSRLIYILIIGVGFSINSFCQTDNQLNTENIDSVKVDFNSHIHKTMGLSINIVDNWKIVKTKANTSIVIENQNEKSYLKISLKEMSQIRESMQLSAEKKSKDNLDDITKKELLEKLIELDSDIQNHLSSKANMSITNTTASKKINDCFLSMTYKTINKKGYLIEAKACRCEDEIKFMIESLKSFE